MTDDDRPVDQDDTEPDDPQGWDGQDLQAWLDAGNGDDLPEQTIVILEADE